MKAALNTLKQSPGDRNTVVGQTKTVAAATNQIVLSAKSIADLADPKAREKLLQLGKATAESVSHLVSAAKAITTNPHDIQSQSGLVGSADRLDANAQDLVEEAEKLVGLANVRQNSKVAAAATASLITQAQNAVVTIVDPLIQGQVLIIYRIVMI